MLFNLLLEGGAEGANKDAGPSWVTFVIFGVLIAAVIGLFIWNYFSNKKKRKAAQEKMEAIKVGDKVKTIGGICGFIVELNNNENTFVLQTGFGDKTCFIKFDKQAIYQTAPANGYFNDVPNPAPAPAPVVEPVAEVKEAPVEEVKEEAPEVEEKKED